MGALPTAAATNLCNNDGITQPERIISASAHKRALFGYILKNKKHRRLIENWYGDYSQQILRSNWIMAESMKRDGFYLHFLLIRERYSVVS